MYRDDSRLRSHVLPHSILLAVEGRAEVTLTVLKDSFHQACYLPLLLAISM
jgi:hypothetical protein